MKILKNMPASGDHKKIRTVKKIRLTDSIEMSGIYLIIISRLLCSHVLSHNMDEYYCVVFKQVIVKWTLTKLVPSHVVNLRT